MRLFIAIEIPAEIKREISNVQERLRGAGADASWTKPDGIHLTMKFLGEVPEAKVPDIMQGLRQAAQSEGPLRLEMKGIGAFPNTKNARIVWIGLAGNIEQLMRLQGAIEDAMAGLGMPREERIFTPHLTLGRIRNIRSRSAWLAAFEKLKDIGLPGFDAAVLSLMKSELKPSGAEYTALGRVEFIQNITDSSS